MASLRGGGKRISGRQLGSYQHRHAIRTELLNKTHYLEEALHTLPNFLTTFKV